ncbi:MAG TPA: hypothetical protein VGC75_05305 [Candidatus Nitrosocosmicus sp.]
MDGDETEIAATALPASIVSYIKEIIKAQVLKKQLLLKGQEAEVKGVKKDLLFYGNGRFLKEEYD